MELLFFVATLPVVALLYYVYHRDIDKEPRHLLARAFVYGCVGVIPVIILELVVGALFPIEEQPTLGRYFLAVLLGVGLIEEGVKWFATYMICYNSGELDHAYDAIVYAVFVSLGFAFVENVEYVFMYGLGTGLVRSFTAIPCHTCTAILMGLFMGQAKKAALLGDGATEDLGLALSLAAPAIAHTIYDFLLMAADSFGLESFQIASLVFMLLFFACGFVIVKKTSAISVNYDGTPAHLRSQIIQGTLPF